MPKLSSEVSPPVQTLQECKIKYTEVQQNNPQGKSINQKKKKRKKMLILRKWETVYVCVHLLEHILWTKYK